MPFGAGGWKGVESRGGGEVTWSQPPLTNPQHDGTRPAQQEVTLRTDFQSGDMRRHHTRTRAPQRLTCDDMCRRSSVDSVRPSLSSRSADRRRGEELMAEKQEVAIS